MLSNLLDNLSRWSASVHLDSARCLRVADVFGRHDACTLCVQACPRQALAVRESGAPAALATDLCDGCGICVRVCPGESLLAAGEQAAIARTLEGGARAATVRYVCSAVRAEVEAHGRAVACLASIDWAELATVTLGAPGEVVLESNDCRQCPRGEVALPEIDRLIAIMGRLAPKLGTRFVWTASSASLQPAAALSRRSLLGIFRRPVAREPAAPARPPAPVQRWLRSELVARLRLLSAPSLARLTGDGLDLGGVSGRPHVEAALCTTCPVCSASCPTQALTLRGDGTLEVADALCNGCGRCVESCRERAMHLSRRVDLQEWARGHRLLASSRPAPCRVCGGTALLPRIGLCASCYRTHGAFAP